MSDGLNKLFTKDPMAFARTHSLFAGNNVNGYRGDLLRTVSQPGVAAATNQRISQVVSGKKVAYVNLKRQKKVDTMGQAFKDNLVQTINEGADTVMLQTDFNQTSPRNFPVYYLPWDDYSGAVRMTIPHKGSLPVDPDVFFTAAINGCSILFQGEPDNPTVYHGGGTTGDAPDLAAQAAYWRTLVSANLHAGGGALSPHEVNKTHYVADPNVVAPIKTTKNANDYEKWLIDKNKKTLKVEYVNPWGCVFGLRRADRWSFYLQENATIVYCTFTKSTVFSGVKTSKYMVSRPTIVRQVYPVVSNGVAVFTPPPKVFSF